ncbi:Protein CBG08322 [Caenorhabditis briggsae]|uniref:Protein CBG08322 n=1 Tax=Caenorhabditis briggsae TaxID=6238 RepID=A8X6A7_CAEBR|nr:Protein CBG08322 [Caenorhabditis briggsae]CAP28168.1 Protein CBG08322 [Caenorhabditis briggsae]
MNLKSYCGTKPYLPLPTVPTKPSAEEHQSLKASCGTKSNLSRRFESRSIAGGKPIQGNEAPWAAKIHYPKISCSSTIISLRHIMSASHCLMSNITKFHDSGNDLIIYPESSELTVRNSNGKLLSDKVSKIIMMNFCLHPNARYDDMMIWELSENIPFDDYAYPACISSGLGYQKHERPRNQDAEKWMFPVKPGVKFREIGNVIQKHANANGFSVVKGYCGHGIHRLFHMAPNVPHYAKNNATGVMKAGNSFIIEPMINARTFYEDKWPDDWTARD